MSTHRSFHNHSSPNYYYYGNHPQQQRGYNPHNANYSWFGGSGSYTTVDHYEYFAPQFWDQYHQTPVFQPPLPYYEQIDDVYVVNDPTDELIETSGMLDNINYMTSQERNSNVNFDSLYGIALHLLDDTYDHDHEEEEDDEDVLKYLKIRTHHAPAKDGVEPEVVAADVQSSETCAICQSEYEHKENIGALQCGHEYHTDCIKQWLKKKKACPMCRASVLPSQE